MGRRKAFSISFIRVIRVIRGKSISALPGAGWLEVQFHISFFDFRFSIFAIKNFLLSLSKGASEVVRSASSRKNILKKVTNRSSTTDDTDNTDGKKIPFRLLYPCHPCNPW